MSLSVEAEILRLLPRVVSPSELAEHLNFSGRSLRRGAYNGVRCRHCRE